MASQLIISSSNLDTRIPFGKYKGTTISDLIQANPAYLIWLHYNTNIFRLSSELRARISDSIEASAYDYDDQEIEEGMGWDG